MHSVIWGMLGITSMPRQTLAIFSTHDPEDGLRALSADDVARISRFYQGSSSRRGALNDATHTVGADLL